MVAAVSAWRLPKLTLERAIEGRLRFVPDVGGDVRYASRCLFERSCDQSASALPRGIRLTLPLLRIPCPFLVAKTAPAPRKK